MRGPRPRKADADEANEESTAIGSSFREQWGHRIDGKSDEAQVWVALEEAAALASQQDEQRCGHVHFLLDECVSPVLQAVAELFGYLATFIDHRGWRTLKDHQRHPHLIDEDLVLVTNNREDWLSLLGAEYVHPGLVVIRENVPRAQQIAYFAKCLVAINALPDMVNTAVEVDGTGAVIVYPLPPER